MTRTGSSTVEQAAYNRSAEGSIPSRCTTLIPLLFLAACSYDIPGEAPAMESYGPELSQALESWSETYSETCDPAEVSVAVVDGDEYNELCGENEDAVGCHSIVPYPTRHVLIIRKRDIDQARNTVTHEAMHWLASCSGVFPDSQEDHSDPAVWGKDGVLERTNEALGLGHD